MYSSLKACSTVAFVHANKNKNNKKRGNKKNFLGDAGTENPKPSSDKHRHGHLY